MPFDNSNPTTTTHPLAACHEAQIDALTLPGLSDEERVKRFAEAAAFVSKDYAVAFTHLAKNKSVAYSVWNCGAPQRSLFANLPGCRCPVMECLPGVPQGGVARNWNPTRPDLEVFARIQQERRA